MHWFKNYNIKNIFNAGFMITIGCIKVAENTKKFGLAYLIFHERYVTQQYLNPSTHPLFRNVA